MKFLQKFFLDPRIRRVPDFIKHVFNMLMRQPLGLSLQLAYVTLFGNIEKKVLYGTFMRGNYAYGLWRAAIFAKFYGHKKVTVCEFGVARGNGLLALIDYSQKVTKFTGIQFRIVGFDSGEGLPEVKSYKDHPELWSPGDFKMDNLEYLEKAIKDKAELYLGDISYTMGDFVNSLSKDSPIGFIVVDFDIYTSSKVALTCLLSDPQYYTPAVSIYFDDINFYFANPWCGELAAINEFNDENELRKISEDRSLPGLRPIKDLYWYKNMYVCHVLDHEHRNIVYDRPSLSIEDSCKMLAKLL